MGDVLTDLSLLTQPASPYFTIPTWQDFLIQTEGKRGIRKKKHLVPETARAGHCARSILRLSLLLGYQPSSANTRAGLTRCLLNSPKQPP